MELVRFRLRATLKDGDPETERHFTTYFGDLLLIKLRARLRNTQTIEDIRQETFLRVLSTLKPRTPCTLRRAWERL
jgi:RNA polymerase sigma-70 factor (ECF subfamily)